MGESGSGEVKLAATQAIAFRTRQLFMAAAIVCACMTVAAAPSCSSASASAPSHGRIWELVTPSDPISAAVHHASLISPDGTRLLYLSIGPTPGAPAGDLLANALATREPDGWTSEALGAPYSVETFSLSSLLAVTPLAFNENLTTSLWEGQTPLDSGGPPEGHIGLYRIAADGAVTPLADMGESGSFVGASKDTTHAVFSSSDHLLPADAGRLKGRSIYEVSPSGLSLVDQTSSGAPVSACGSQVAASGGVSESGSRIFFTSPAPSNSTCPTPKQVYMRENGSATVDLSASDCTRADCNGAQDVHFSGATPDGSSVFLSTTQQLTNSDTDLRRDLYRYDVDSGMLAQISAGPDEATGQVTKGPVLTSADGSSTYFYAQGRLLADEGSSGGENLYLVDESGLHFVAAVGESDPLQISRDGRTALLATAVALEPGDADGHKDVYLYSADSGTFARLSKGSMGGNGEFDADIASPTEAIGSGPAPADRALSDDGSRAFFSTTEQLLPDDVNEATDVYEWAGGSLGLVSPGTGSDDAEFAGASADGSTVVFKTSESLTPSDRDGGEADLYAARLGGGFPATAAPPQCLAACTPPPYEPVSTPAPKSTGDVSGRPGRHLRLRSLGSRTARRLAAGRRARVIVWTPVAGSISARARVRTGERLVTAAFGRAGAVRPGAVRIRLRATRIARRILRRRGLLTVRLEFRQSDLRLTRHIRLRIRRGHGLRQRP